MATPNYSVNYDDKRFTEVEADKKAALNQVDVTYGNMIGQSDKYFDKQIDAAQNWADKQSQIQQENTDFAIEKIEQQKQQAQQDYTKEQSGAYVDWQKQSNKYGTNAEQMASAGLTGTGFAESSQVSMYNTYQNRVAAARESYNQAVLNYNNAIKDAMLQNNEALAQIAYESLQKSLELSLAGFQYKNQLILEQSNKKIELDNMYYNRYQDVLQQINHENAIKEDIRQYNETQKWNTEQAELGREHDKAMADIEYQYQVKRDEATRTFQSAQAELDRKHDLALVKANTAAAKEKADHEHELAMKQLAQQHKNDLAKIDKQLASEKALLAEQNKYKSVGTVSGSKTTSNKSYANAAKNSFTSRVTNNPRVNTTTSKFTGSTYDSAVSYLKSKGASTAGVLTASEWSRRKSSYSMTGIGNAAVKNYSSYAAYLRDYVNYTVSNK
mgnify:CR=1 FL=1